MADEDKHGVLYSYVNIGSFASPGWLGRVVGFAGTTLMGCLYTYANVLDWIMGGNRTIEGGAERTIEGGAVRTVEEQSL